MKILLTVINLKKKKAGNSENTVDSYKKILLTVTDSKNKKAGTFFFYLTVTVKSIFKAALTC